MLSIEKPNGNALLVTLLIANTLAASPIGATAQSVSVGTSLREISSETQKEDPRVDQVIDRANDHFRKGKRSVEDNKREQARDEFDKAVDEILMSGIDVRTNHRLQSFYLELVERIYREEVPITQDQPVQADPQIGFRNQTARASEISSAKSTAPSVTNSAATTFEKETTLPSNRSQARRIPAGGYSWQPFDPSIAEVPAGFRGHDLAKIYDLLLARQKDSVKGEFETTESFNLRMKAAATKPLLGTLTKDSVFAFGMDNKRLESLFDADKQTLHVRANLSVISEGLTHRSTGKALTWEINRPETTYYVGSNAFGAKTRVERNRGEFFEVGFDNYDDFPVEYYLSDSTKEVFAEKIQRGDDLSYLKEVAFAVDLKVNAQAAMRLKKDLRVLVVCRLIPPYRIEGSIFHEPTRDDPTDRLYNFHTLFTRLLELWFFDVSNGQVLAKQKIRGN
jgi:hypothetical protein